jgi:hypothetical protein
VELDRRSPQFSRLAAAIERELEWRGLAVDPERYPARSLTPGP